MAISHKQAYSHSTPCSEKSAVGHSLTFPVFEHWQPGTVYTVCKHKDWQHGICK